MTNRQEDLTGQTRDIIARFNEVFQTHDPAALAELVAPDCIIENSVPAPDGARYEGRDACISLWSGIATAPETRFDTEDVFVVGDRAVIRWRYHWGDGQSVRGGQSDARCKCADRRSHGLCEGRLGSTGRHAAARPNLRPVAREDLDFK